MSVTWGMPLAASRWRRHFRLIDYFGFKVCQQIERRCADPVKEILRLDALSLLYQPFFQLPFVLLYVACNAALPDGGGPAQAQDGIAVSLSLDWMGAKAGARVWEKQLAHCPCIVHCGLFIVLQRIMSIDKCSRRLGRAQPWTSVAYLLHLCSIHFAR